jgi:hypothetical protein
MDTVRVMLDARCSYHWVVGKDTGVYYCKNCKYCINKRQTLSGSYVGDCKNPKQVNYRKGFDR